MNLLHLALVLALQAPPPLSPAAPQPHAERLADAEARTRALDDAGARDILAALADDPTAPADVRARAAMLLGQVQCNLGDADAATAAFARVLGADARATTPAPASDCVKTAWERASRAVTARSDKPAALPAKTDAPQEPVLQWMRPSSVVLMVVGGVVLAAGGLVVVAGGVAREYALRQSDQAQREAVTRGLVPLALLAVSCILLSIPIGGMGLAMFFLSGLDGPVRSIMARTERKD